MSRDELDDLLIMDAWLRRHRDEVREVSVPIEDPQHAAAPASEAAPGATMLHQDPVCGTYVAADSSLKRIFDGKVLHFCSQECRDRYHG